MIDFDPISAEAARMAIDRGVYGKPEHARIEFALRGGVVVSAVTPEARDLVKAVNRYLTERFIWHNADDLPTDECEEEATELIALVRGWSPPVTPEARELDPLPWRCFDCGRNMAGPAGRGHEPRSVHLSPRPEFDQDPAHYPEGGKP